MPQLKYKLPSYCHHKASGQAVVSIEGRDVYLGAYGSRASRDEYDRIIAEWMARKRAGVVYASDGQQRDLVVNEVIVRYLDHAKSYYVKNGELTKEEMNIRHSLKHLARLYGTQPVRTFGPAQLKVVRQAMIDDDLCRTLINSRVNRIRRMMKWGVESQLVSPDILHALQAVSPLKRGRCSVRETEPVRPVSESDMEAVARVVTPTVAAMIRLQWFSGMRPGEVVQMRECDLDTAGEDWTYRPQAHKTQHFGIKREIHLGPKAKEIVKQLLVGDPTAFLFSPRKSTSQRYQTKPTHRHQAVKKPKTKRKIGSRYTTQTYGRAIAYGCGLAGIPPWSPNQLRHATATRLRKERGLDAAQAVLGHKRADVTQVYAELDKNKAIEVMRELG